MVLARAFDLKAVSLQRTGRLGTYAVALGQEAVAAGVASAMRSEDVLLPSYRDNAALLGSVFSLAEIRFQEAETIENALRRSTPAKDVSGS